MNSLHGRPRGAERNPVVTLLAFPLTESGGIAAFVRGLLASLEADHGVTVRLIAPTSRDVDHDTPRGRIGFAARALLALVRSQPPAIHSHENLPLLCSALAFKLLSFGRARVVHTVHVDPALRSAWWRRAIAGCLFAMCDRVVVVSEDTRRRLCNVSMPLRRNVDVIYGAPPHGSDPSDEAVAAFSRSLGLGPGPVVCQISRFYYPLKVKGVERLLEAFRLVRQTLPDTQLLLVGSGPLWETFKVRHGLEATMEGVTLTGFVEDARVPMVLADVYCHISFQDALPMVVLEAMSLGKVVVASAVGGVPEVIVDGVSGLLTTSALDDLVGKLLRLLRAPGDAVDLGREAERQIGERFSWERCAAAYAALYGGMSRKGVTVPWSMDRARGGLK